MLWLNGGLRWRADRRAATAATIALPRSACWQSRHARDADEASDQFALDAVEKTHLAYVVTGNAEVDATSRAGLDGLSDVLAERTALEPGDPIGVDPVEATNWPSSR